MPAPRSRRSFVRRFLGSLMGGSLVTATGVAAAAPDDTSAQLEPVVSQEGFLGEVKMFAGNFAPRTWAFCEGQLLAISSNQALFSILGTIYGGDGRTSFALPDLRGRVPVGPGSGPGLSTRQLGSRSGSETTTLTTPNLPAHTHGVNVNSGEGTTSSPVSGFLASNTVEGRVAVDQTYAATAGSSMAASAIANTGSNQAVNNMQPYLGIYYIICLSGTFPSRN
jgi:microcystin-dependent protein